MNEDQLFFIQKPEFNTMINIMKGKKSSRRKPRMYRMNGFQIIFESKLD
jgi:hypothetical protein